MKNRTNLYLAWFIATSFGILVMYRMYSGHNDKTIVYYQKPLESGSILVGDSTGTTQLVSIIPVKQLRLLKDYILVEQDTLTIAIDTLNGNVFKTPKQLDSWKNFFIAWLGSSNLNDSKIGWNTTKSQLENCLQNQLDSLNKSTIGASINTDRKLFIALIKKMEQGGRLCIYERKLMNNTFTVQPIKAGSLLQIIPPSITAKSNATLTWIDYVSIVSFILSIALGVYFSSLKEDVIQETSIESIVPAEKEDSPWEAIDHTPPPAILPNDSPITTVVPVTNEVEEKTPLDVYMDGFNKKYGSFYGKVQQLSINPSRQEKNRIKQDLIEMAVHAISLMRAYRMNNLETPIKEPNLLLIMENKQIHELPKQAYRTYIHDAEKMEKRYSILLEIIQEIGIDKMEALLSDVYLSESFLKEKKH